MGGTERRGGMEKGEKRGEERVREAEGMGDKGWEGRVAKDGKRKRQERGKARLLIGEYSREGYIQSHTYAQVQVTILIVILYVPRYVVTGKADILCYPQTL